MGQNRARRNRLPTYIKTSLHPREYIKKNVIIQRFGSLLAVFLPDGKSELSTFICICEYLNWIKTKLILSSEIAEVMKM